MLKRATGLVVAVAAVLVATGACAADTASMKQSTSVKPDGSYTVTDSLPAREACPTFRPTVVAQYSSSGLPQAVRSDLFCGSYVEKVFAPDGSVRMSRRFEGQEDRALPRLASVELMGRGNDWKHAVILLSPTRDVQVVTVYFGPAFHDVVLICTRQPDDGNWHIDEVSVASRLRHEVMTVPTLRGILPAEIPASFADVEHAWHGAFTEATVHPVSVAGM